MLALLIIAIAVAIFFGGYKVGQKFPHPKIELTDVGSTNDTTAPKAQ